MPRSLKLFTLFGTPVRVNYTWPIAPIFITIALGAWLSEDEASAQQIAVTYGFAAFTALCLAASVLIHEFAHVLVARRLGIRATDITLFALGGVSRLDEQESGASRELAISIAGPIGSIALGVACYLFSILLTAPFAVACQDTFAQSAACAAGPSLLGSPFYYLAIANIIIGLFNLLPLFPLDGGRILSATLWAITGNRDKALRIAALIGQLGAAAIIAYGAYNLFFGELLVSIWLIAIGVFLMEAAIASAPTKESPLPEGKG